MTAHNSFVLAAAELGLIGFFVFCAILWQASKSVRRSVRIAATGATRDVDEAALGQALIASLLAYLVCGFFLSQTYAPILHILLALIVALAKVQRDRLRMLGIAPAPAPRPSGAARASAFA